MMEPMSCANPHAHHIKMFRNPDSRVLLCASIVARLHICSQATFPSQAAQNMCVVNCCHIEKSFPSNHLPHMDIWQKHWCTAFNILIVFSGPTKLCSHSAIVNIYCSLLSPISLPSYRFTQKRLNSTSLFLGTFLFKEGGFLAATNNQEQKIF